MENIRLCNNRKCYSFHIHKKYCTYFLTVYLSNLLNTLMNQFFPVSVQDILKTGQIENNRHSFRVHATCKYSTSSALLPPPLGNADAAIDILLFWLSGKIPTSLHSFHFCFCYCRCRLLLLLLL